MPKFTRDEFITAWLEALRSGRYTKGEFSYHSALGCHCTLGVALDIIEPGFESAVHPFKELMEILPEVSPNVGDGNLYLQITSRNDGDRNLKPHTFLEMADFLEGVLCQKE